MAPLKRVFVHLPDYQATGFYRAVLPARHCTDPLAAEGIELVLSGELKSWDKYDAYIFHRLFNPKFLPTVGNIKRRGERVVLETDDDLWNIPDWNPAKLTDDDLGVLSLACSVADKLFVSTENLARVSGHPEKCHVCPNLMDVSQWPEPKKRTHKGIRVLWAGSATHKLDLEVLVEVIDRVKREVGDQVQFLFWGYCHPEIIRRHYLDNIRFINPVTLSDYIPHLMDIAADIALCPLAEDPFNLSKSNIKWMEMSLSGAAVVASAFGPYQCIQNGKDGLLASTVNDWVKHIVTLTESMKLRTEMNYTAISRINSNLAWQSHARDAWLDAFRAIVA